MRLDKIDDPRSNLEKRRRIEMWRFAKKRGLDRPQDGLPPIKEGMPAKIMRKRLAMRKIYDLDTPHLEPVLGAKRGQGAIDEQDVQTIDALSNLERQYEEQEESATLPVPGKKLRIWELRKACRDAGHKVKNTHKAHELKAMLYGQNAS